MKFEISIANKKNKNKNKKENENCELQQLDSTVTSLEKHRKKDNLFEITLTFPCVEPNAKTVPKNFSFPIDKKNK